MICALHRAADLAPQVRDDGLLVLDAAGYARVGLQPRLEADDHFGGRDILQGRLDDLCATVAGPSGSLEKVSDSETHRIVVLLDEVLLRRAGEALLGVEERIVCAEALVDSGILSL